MKSLSRSTIIKLRKQFLAPSLQTFEAYDDPFIISKGKMQHIWDENGKKYFGFIGSKFMY